MAKNGYIVTHSNYTEKKKHKELSNSDIYERDYMTTTNLGGWDSGSIPYGEGNFKIIDREDDYTKRKHKYGNWLLNENCTEEDSENCEFFTLDSLPNSGETTEETKIVSKPSKNSLLDYVYYGNCEELINTSIENIVANYPGELYITDQPFEYIGADGIEHTLGDMYQYNDNNLVVVDNPFEIDIVSLTNTSGENPLRYFCDSANDYELITDTNEKIHFSWNSTIETGDTVCFYDGQRLATVELRPRGETTSFLTIYQFYLNGNKILLTENPNRQNNDNNEIFRRIRPNYETLEKVFNNFDSFEKFLLNRDSKPLYKIELDTPTETDYGVLVSRKSYTWPTINDWNLDIYSEAFKQYYEGLNSIARWYDENRTDNLWRNMVHEAIKNMDQTIVDTVRDEDGEDYKIGKSNLHGLMLAYGRQFDEIKHDIDNIKTTNTVTYNENNNTPDYFLSDQVNLSGWEVKSVVETLEKDTTTSDLYPGDNKEYNLTDTNLQFLRNIKLNSRGIFTRKGTKQAVEMTLALFGYKSYDWAKKYYEALSNNKKPKRGRRPLNFDELPSDNEYAQYDYKLNEYVVTVKNTSSDVVPIAQTLPVETYNKYKRDYNGQESTVEGLPVRLVYFEKHDDNDNVSIYKYIIPWFDKYEDLDGDPYFQMYGGWERECKKTVIPNKELYPNVNEIYSISGFTVFNETRKYLKVVETLGNLINVDPDTLNENDVYYVNDISDIEDYVPEIDVTGATNYFIIKNIKNCYFCGTDESGQTGWINISKEVLSCENWPSADAYRVIYLENIIESNSGNNPHVGYAKYDNGETYLNYFRQLFKGAIDNNLFGDDAYDCDSGKIIDEIENLGFETETSVDNVKTWYFTDTTNENNIYQLKTSVAITDEGDEIPNGYEVDENADTTVNVGYNAYVNHEVGFNSEMSAFNLETQEGNSNDEAAANSIINTKKLVLEFSNELNKNKEFYTYFNTCVLPYVEQVVPSTTIFEINLESSYWTPYVKFTSLEDGSTVSLTQISSFQHLLYSSDNQNTWNEFETNTEIVLDSGKSIYVIGKLTGKNSEQDYTNFKLEGQVSITGNINALWNYQNLVQDLYGYCGYGLFSGCTGLVDASELTLGTSATTLASGCCFRMFNGCTSLTTAPILPATTLAGGCYRYMFAGCTSLTTAPELPATTLANSCYYYMFYNCTSLTTTSELPATTLRDDCYYGMFQGCRSLKNAPSNMLPATILASYCYFSMFNGCTSLTTAPELPATALTYSCYGGMFNGCTSLTTAPELCATELSQGCYYSMFRDCSGLTTAPELSATVLYPSCYWGMFSGCTSLETAPELPATTLRDSCYRDMFNGCTSLETAPELPATALTYYCYYGMFNGCSKLQYIKCLATNISANNCTKNWVSGVASSGVFIRHPDAENWSSGISGIPNGWDVIPPLDN